MFIDHSGTVLNTYINLSLQKPQWVGDLVITILHMRRLRLREGIPLAQGCAACKRWCWNSRQWCKARAAPGWQCSGNGGKEDLGPAKSWSWAQRGHHSYSSLGSIPAPPLAAVWPWASYLASLCFSFLPSKMGIMVKFQRAPICKQWHTKDGVRGAAHPKCCRWGGALSFENSKHDNKPYFINCFFIIAVYRQPRTCQWQNTLPLRNLLLV